MTDLRRALEGYLSLRQGLGYKYQHQARRLADFVSFMETRKATTITPRSWPWHGRPCHPIGMRPGPCD